MKILSIRGVQNVTATALFIILTKCVYNIVLIRRIAEILTYKVHDENVGTFFNDQTLRDSGLSSSDRRCFSHFPSAWPLRTTFIV